MPKPKNPRYQICPHCGKRVWVLGQYIPYCPMCFGSLDGSALEQMQQGDKTVEQMERDGDTQDVLLLGGATLLAILSWLLFCLLDRFG